MRPERRSRTDQSPSAFDLIATGRAVVDLYPEQHGVGLADVHTFAKYLGGSPANVAVQAARLGSRAALVTKVGADAFGDFVCAALERFGVDPRWVGTDPTAKTTIAFCEIKPPDDFPLLFYRDQRPPDMNLRPADFDMREVRNSRILWTTGTALSAEPSRSTILDVLDTRAGAGSDRRRPITVHDIDLRPALWQSVEEAVDVGRQALRFATVVVGNTDETEFLVGEHDPLAASRALLDCGPDLAIVKLGAEGVIARTREQVITLPPVSISVANGLGAGDAFGGMLAHGLAHEWRLEDTLRLANAAGAFAASKVACADDFGTLEEIVALVPSTEAPLASDAAGAVG